MRFDANRRLSPGKKCRPISLVALALAFSAVFPLTFISLRAQEQGSGFPGAELPSDIKMIIPERELAVKIKAPFTLAAVGDIIGRHPMAQLNEPGFQNLIKTLRNADVGFANMEGPLIDFSTFPGAVTAAMPKSGIADLKAMGIRMMNTANNHSMDGGVPGMLETNALLDEAGIVHAGTGKDLQEARGASFLDTPKGTVGLVGMFSIEPASGPPPASTSGATYRNGDLGGMPGVNGLHVTPYYIVTAEQLQQLRQIRDSVYARRGEVPDPVPALPENEPADRLQLFGTWYKVGPKPGNISYTMNQNDLREILRSIRNGKEYADFMIVTIHCHQANYAFQQYTFDNDVPDFLVELAHKAIDAGADVFVGHGVHTLRGIEIYKGKPIFYGLSNFVHQEGQSAQPANPGGDLTEAESVFRPGSEPYRVHQHDNLEALLTTSRFEGGHLVEVRLFPTDLGQDGSRPLSRFGIPMTPLPQMAVQVLEKLQKISQRFGTTISIENNVGVIRVASNPRETRQ